MSERYQTMIVWARDQILPRLDSLEPPDLQRFQANGWDALAQQYKDLMMRISQDSLEKENYELSYTQTCNALYQAFQIKGWLA
jgi:hypothetical protein